MASKNVEALGRHRECRGSLRASHTKSIDNILNEINNTIETKKLSQLLMDHLCQLSGDQFTSATQVKQLAQSISAQRGLLEKEEDFKDIQKQLLRILKEISQSNRSKTSDDVKKAASGEIRQWECFSHSNYDFKCS